MSQQGPAAGLEALSAAVLCVGPLEGSCHYLHYLHHSLASGQIRGREHSPTSTENWIKDLLSMAHPSEQDPVSPSVSLSQ